MSDTAPQWTSSVVTRAVDKVLEALLGDDRPEVVSYGANSEALWDWMGRRGEIPSRLVLVWDGSGQMTSLAGRNTVEYLSPLTWALCAARQSPATRIVILDCAPARHKTGRFCRAVESIDPVKRPFGLITDPCRSVDAILEFFKHPRSEEVPTVTNLLTQQVRTMLTERGDESDHHALANIIGPLILMGKLDEAVAEPSRRALRTLFRDIGLLGRIKASAKSSAEMPPTFGARAVRLLLVDDQHRHGWTEWVESMVRGEPTCTVEATDRPDDLVDAVREGLDRAEAENKLDCRFELSIASPEGAQSRSDAETVLLLDLRLFSLRREATKTPEQVEAAFVQDHLLPLCQRFTVDADAQVASFAWPGFTTEEMVKVTEWCDTPERDTDGHLLALSLLPRLLALTDMSLPIVLFSSTGQRKIIEYLKPYGSITTDFEKPRFTGLESEDLVEETETRFRAALKKAVDWSRAAKQVKALQSLSFEPYEAAKRDLANKRYIEFFHDECFAPGSPLFRVATFAVAFMSVDDADRTDVHIRENGPLFYGPGAKQKITNIKQGREQWRSEVAQPLSAALRCGNAGSLPMLLPFVVVAGSPAKRGPSDDLFALLDPSGLDNEHQDLLRLLLEAMIVDTVAWVAPPEMTCGVFGATRMRSQRVTPDIDAEYVRRTLWERWRIGPDRIEIEVKKDGTRFVKWQSLRLDSLHVLLNELLSARGKSEVGTHFAAGIRRGYCTTLPTEKDVRANPGYRHLHSIADIVSRLVDVDLKTGRVTWGDVETNPDLPIPVRGFAGLRSRIVRILNCHRALDEGDLVDGFGYGLGVDYEHDLAGNVVARRMRDLIPRLSGEDFSAIVRHVVTGGPRWTHSPRQQDRTPQSIFQNKPRIRSGGARDVTEAEGDVPPEGIPGSDQRQPASQESPTTAASVPAEPACVEQVVSVSANTKPRESLFSRVFLALLTQARVCMGRLMRK